MNLPDQALWDAFQDGHQFRTVDGRLFEMARQDAGTLVVPSGRIVACDPLQCPGCEPFSIRVRPGEYPLRVAMTADDLALVMVRFRQGRPSRWKPAVPESFGVDTASGCLMDYRLARLLRRKAMAGEYEQHRHQLSDPLERGRPWASVTVDDVGGANVFVFRTRDGHGRFPSFYGYNATGRLICLITDMFLNSAAFNGPETAGDLA
ncbi:MAG: DUF4241 domain-containing protein [Planctomycetes bacterium]|nr:DUF4241 domain-containing protein [Planctomycetota bacterium]